jgi:hypothetical protein
MEAEAMKNNAYFSVDKNGQLTFTEQGLMNRDFLWESQRKHTNPERET